MAAELSPIPYYEWSEFEARFPRDPGDPDKSKLGSGSFGSVYSSGNVAIKEQGDDWDISPSSIRELNAYASILHPCIVRPVAWSFRPKSAAHLYAKTYIAISKGESIVTAFDQKKITIEEIVSDTLSALAYLNSIGLVHADMKPSNIIFHEGKAKLIDFGLCRRAAIFEDKYYITDSSYTDDFKDPEYSIEQWNPISCEVYPLAKTYHFFYANADTHGSLYNFSTPQIPHLDWFLTEAKKPSSIRHTTFELLEMAPKELIVRHWEGATLETPVIPIDSQCGPAILTPMARMVEIAANADLKAETLFLGLHLYRRVIPHLVPDYGKGDQSKKMEAIGVMCLHLATIANSQKFTYSKYMNTWIKVFKDVFTFNQLQEFLVQVMDCVGCIIGTNTYWDYASCGEDLPGLLDDTISCTYDPSRIRPLLYGKFSKDVGSRNLRMDWRRYNPMGITSLVENMWTIPDAPYVSVVHSVQKEYDNALQTVEFRWGDFLYAIKLWEESPDGERPKLERDEVGVLLHNREILDRLELDRSQKIYDYLRTHGGNIGAEVLAILCHFDTTTVPVKTLIEKGLNPFVATAADVAA
jgi:serine/threonine protein kinase